MMKSIKYYLEYIKLVIDQWYDPSELDLGYSRYDLPIDKISIDIIEECKNEHKKQWEEFYKKYGVDNNE